MAGCKNAGCALSLPPSLSSLFPPLTITLYPTDIAIISKDDIADAVAPQTFALDKWISVSVSPQ